MSGLRILVPVIGALLLPIPAARAGAAVRCGSASEPSKMLWGPSTLPDGASAFPVYQRLGVDMLEHQLPWSSVAATRPAHPTDPNDPAYHWPVDTGNYVRAAKAAGIKVALMVKSTPDWANGGQGVGQAPDDPGDYADFLTAASRHYRSVHHWMIWGEPTREGNFTPMPENSPVGPRRYAILLDRAYGALKRQSAKNIVIGGMTWTVGLVTADKFVKWMRLPNGKPPRLDYYGHNPFSVRYPLLAKQPYFPGLRDMSDVDTLGREVARAYRGTGRRPALWLSEYTVPSDRANRGFNFFVSRPEQAKWLTAGFTAARQSKCVVALGWYSLLDEGTTTSDPILSGLMTAGGGQKPAFAAFRRVR